MCIKTLHCARQARIAEPRTKSAPIFESDAFNTMMARLSFVNIVISSELVFINNINNINDMANANAY